MLFGQQHGRWGKTRRRRRRRRSPPVRWQARCDCRSGGRSIVRRAPAPSFPEPVLACGLSHKPYLTIRTDLAAMCFAWALSFATQLDTGISTRIKGNTGREPESFTDIAWKLPMPGVIVTRLAQRRGPGLARNPRSSPQRLCFDRDGTKSAPMVASVIERPVSGTKPWKIPFISTSPRNRARALSAGLARRSARPSVRNYWRPNRSTFITGPPSRW